MMQLPSLSIRIEAGDWCAAYGKDEAALHDEIARILACAASCFEGMEDELNSSECAVLLTDNAHIQALNAQFRNKNKPTNVLSFPAPPAPQGVIQSLGDIAFAYETCAQEAQEEGKSFVAHFSHLVVHGFLHLLGYDHIEADDADEMETLEREILEKLGIDDPYQGELDDG